jgi:pimeloyl-ACP methyl ester carboxylesterase
MEIVLQHGHARPVAEWLAMNLRRADKHEGALPAEGRSTTAVPPADRSRLEALAAQRSGVYLHVLEGAGHLVHVDDPDGLVEIMQQALCR